MRAAQCTGTRVQQQSTLLMTRHVTRDTPRAPHIDIEIITFKLNIRNGTRH